MKPTQYTEKQMHLGLDWKPLSYKQEAILIATRMKLETTAFSDPLHLLAKT